jgi:hypothetical protein
MADRKVHVLHSRIYAANQTIGFLEDMRFISDMNYSLDQTADWFGVKHDSFVRRVQRLNLIDDLFVMVPRKNSRLSYALLSRVNWQRLIDARVEHRDALRAQLDRATMPPFPPLPAPRLPIADHEDLPRYTPSQ